MSLATLRSQSKGNINNSPLLPRKILHIFLGYELYHVIFPVHTQSYRLTQQFLNILGGSLIEAARIIHDKEGFRGFARGLRPRIVTTMPSTAICWTSYEMAKYAERPILSD